MRLVTLQPQTPKAGISADRTIPKNGVSMLIRQAFDQHYLAAARQSGAKRGQIETKPGVGNTSGTDGEGLPVIQAECEASV